MSWRRGKRPNAARWQKVRLQVLDRDGWRCVRCGRAGRLEVDHKTPLEDGGDMYGLRNLGALCRGCHIEKTREEGRRRHVKALPQEQKDWRALLEQRVKCAR